MRSVLIAVFVMAASGCTFGLKTCDVNTDCNVGSTCSNGFCVAGDSGTGGGSTGGGTTTGGGSGGGGGATGGGTGGGTETCAQSVIDSCEDWEECSATAEGGTCVDADYRLSWTAPVQLKEVKEASIAGLLTVTKGDGGTVALTSVPVSGAAAAFSGTSGLYSGMLQLSGAEGVKSFVAGWPSPGPRQELQLVRDTTPPEVSLSVELRPASLGDPEPAFVDYWKKDESAIIRVIVDGGMPAAVMNVQTAWSGTVTSTSCLTPCAGNCQCFAVDLAGASLNAQRGQVTVTVSAVQDNAGNDSFPQNVSANVTRFKWAKSLSTTAPLRPIAIANNGIVVWGVESGGGDHLYAVSQDGGMLWSAIDGSVISAGPVIGNSDVWIATSWLSGVETRLQSVPLTTGVGGVGRCIENISTRFEGDLALSTYSGSEFPIGLRAGMLNAPTGTSGCRMHELAPTPPSATPRPSVVVLSRDGGGIESFVAYENAQRLWKAELVSNNWVDRGDAGLPMGTQPRGLFLDGVEFVGGGGGVAGNGAVFSTSSAASLSPSTAMSSIAASNAGPPAVGPGYLVYGDVDGTVHRRAYANGAISNSGVSVPGGIDDLQTVTPIIGAGDRIYFVSFEGNVTIRRATDLQEIWKTTGGSALAVSEPALDVYRGMNGVPDCNKPLGVLYILSQTSSSATLRALLVDSKGLEPTAPWPKYQRDNANTGNASRSLDSWTCP